MATTLPDVPRIFLYICFSVYLFVCFLLAVRVLCVWGFQSGRKAEAVLTVKGSVPSSLADVSYRKHGRKAGEL